MKLEVINLGNIKKPNSDDIIIIDRRSVLGNPYGMNAFKNQINERERVCDKYQIFFDNIIQKYRTGLMLTQFEINFITELYRIYKLSQIRDIYLGCWCAPKRCHGYTIISFIKNEADEIFNGGLRWEHQQYKKL